MNCDLHAMFDEMYESFHSDDEIRVEDTHREIMKHWLDFLSAGFDATKVAAMMPPGEVYTHYDVLISYGAKIDATELAFELEDADYVKEHLAEFALRGADINRIAKEILKYDLWLYYNDEIEKIIEGGVDTDVVFEMAQEKLLLETEGSTDGLRSMLSMFLNHGLSVEKIQEWVMDNRNIYIVEDIVENPENWEKFGVEMTDEIVREFMMENDWRILEDMKLYLPKTISPEKFLEYISVDDAMMIGNSYEFENFIDSYVDAGGELEKLAKWFFNEKGYTPDELCISAMFDIAWRDPSLVNMEKFVDCCKKCDEITEENRHDYYEDFSRREEIDKEILARLL